MVPDGLLQRFDIPGEVFSKNRKGLPVNQKAFCFHLRQDAAEWKFRRFIKRFE